MLPLALVAFSALGADEALAALDRQVRAEPINPLPRIEAAQRRVQAGEELDRAYLDLDVARALAPENPRAHFVLGQLMEERGELAQARAAYQAALSLRDDYDDARFRLAGLLFSGGAFADAAALYARYLAGHADATGARVQLAVALERAGDAAAAERELKALYSDPKTRELGGRKLAELYQRTGREREATRLREKVEPPRRKLRALQPSGR